MSDYLFGLCVGLGLGVFLGFWLGIFAVCEMFKAQEREAERRRKRQREILRGMFSQVNGGRGLDF